MKDDCHPTLIPNAMRTIRMNQVPLCHRLLRPHTPVPVSRDEEVNTLNRILADRGAMGCVGSRCVMWVPEVRRGKLLGALDYADDRHDVPVPDDITPTSKGWCAENMRTAPFVDPADAKKEDTP